MKTIKDILTNRDKMSDIDADKKIEKAINDIKNGSDPYEIVHIYFALPPEYVFDLV